MTNRSTPRGTILNEDAAWDANSGNGHYPTNILSFFCVVILRDVYNQLNGLDENGLGYNV